MKSTTAFALLALQLAACSGGPAGISPVPLQGAPNGNTQASGSERIYVANSLSSTVVAFDASANGNVAPLFTITGPTGCNFGAGVHGVDVDSLGRVYATNVAAEEVDIFTISSSLVPAQTGAIVNGIYLAQQMAIDRFDHLYVANQNQLQQNGGIISVYAPGPSGANRTIATISGPATGFDPLGPVGVAVDSAGEVYAAIPTNDVIPDRILVFAPGANGNVAPVREISGPKTLLSSPFSLAVDASGKVYAANFVGSSPGITVYANGANGDVAPVADITGPHTTLLNPNGVAVDSSGRIYVSQGTPSETLPTEIAVFAPGVSGDVAPIAVITGPATGLSGPANLVVR